MQGRIVANLYGKHRGPRVNPVPIARPPIRLANPLVRKSIPYRLQVETLMKRSDLPALTRGAKQLIDLIESTGALRLVHASMEVNDNEVRLFHYWNMGYDADALTVAELELPDMPGYARFEKLIIDEIKDIVIPTARARLDPPALSDLTGRYVYLRAQYQIRTGNLSEFQARLESSVVPLGQKNGWFLGDSYLGITGLSGKIVQFWIVPENAVALAPARLAAAPWQDLLRDTPICKFLEPLPLDPFLGELARANRPAQARGEREDPITNRRNPNTTSPGAINYAK